MTKAEVSSFLTSFTGVTTHYSGKERKMYINDPKKTKAEDLAIEHFGYNIPFALATNKVKKATVKKSIKAV